MATCSPAPTSRSTWRSTAWPAASTPPFSICSVAGPRCGGGACAGAGRVLKSRLLAGALRLDIELVRQLGVGHLLGRVIESQALESLVFNGGFAVGVALIELAFAAWVLTLGAAPLPQPGQVGHRGVDGHHLQPQLRARPVDPAARLGGGVAFVERRAQRRRAQRLRRGVAEAAVPRQRLQAFAQARDRPPQGADGLRAAFIDAGLRGG